MVKYTYDNILINPSKEGIESLIGKEVYFHNNPYLCLDYANKKSTDHLGVLAKIRKNSAVPFTIEQGNTVHEYTCIIIKKEQSEPKPKHVQFQDGREFFNSYLSVESRLEKEDYFLSNHGIWLMNCENGDYFLVTEIWGDGVVLGSNQTTTHWDDLLEEFIFLDGSPCGKESKDE